MPDQSEVTAEAYESVERGGLTEEDLRDFVFATGRRFRRFEGVAEPGVRPAAGVVVEQVVGDVPLRVVECDHISRRPIVERDPVTRSFHPG